MYYRTLGLLARSTPTPARAPRSCADDRCHFHQSTVAVREIHQSTVAVRESTMRVAFAARWREGLS